MNGYSNSGSVSLISTQGAVMNGDITSTSGGIAILATQNITTNNIHSQNGTVILSSHAGAVTTGNITTDGGSVSVAGGGDIVIHTILSHGGGVSLISSQGAVTTSGNIIASNDVDIVAGGNVATSNILSDAGAVNLTSSSGSITARGDIATKSGFVDIEASGDVATHSITSKNGAVSLISNQGIITATGDITTEGGYVNIEATENVATRNILSDGGGIYLTSAKGSVNTGFLNSDGNGTGGDVDVQAAGVFQATGSVAINGKNYSIYAGNGSVNSGEINIIAQGSAALLSESISPNYSKDLGKSQGTQPDTSSIQLANDPTFHLEIHQDLWPSQINLSPNQQQQLEGFIKQLWNAVQPLAEFVLGTMYQFLYDNGGSVRALLPPLQLTPKEEALWERTLLHSTAFKLGRTLGGGAAIVQGIVEVLAGTGTEAGGGGLCITGIGCFAGAPAIAAGAILQSHGAATAIFSAGEEGKLLRDLLSPNRMESSMGDSEELAKELGVSSGQIEQALHQITPGKVRQLHGELGQDLFEQLLGKDEKVIKDVSRELDLVGNDTAAVDGIKTTLRSEDIKPDELKNVFSELVNFSERYQGRVSGEFAYRFGRANAPKLDTIGATGEIRTAEDILEGRTPLGSIREVDGIPGNVTKKGQAPEKYTTPDFLVTEADGVTRLAEVKTPTGSVSKTNINNNLRDAISSIKGSNKNPTGKAYIRLDYRQAASTNLTPDQIFRDINGRMVRVDDQTGIKGTDVVEFVEVLYKDTAGQAQKLVLQVQNGKLVILP